MQNQELKVYIFLSKTLHEKILKVSQTTSRHNHPKIEENFKP